MVHEHPLISIGEHTLEVMEDFTYLCFTISSNLSWNTELNTRIWKAVTAMGRLTKRIWSNAILTTNTKMKVYQACVLSILLYGSESLTLCSRQKRRLNAFHMRRLRKILGIVWQDRVKKKDGKAYIPTMFSLFSETLTLA